MKRRRSSALAGAAVLFMTVALAASIAVTHEAKTINKPAAQPVEGQTEQTAPLRRLHFPAIVCICVD